MESNDHFEKWLVRLKTSTQDFGVLNDKEINDLVTMIKSVITDESTKVPDWVKSYSSSTLRELSSTDEDIKLILRHVALPYAITAFNKMLQSKKDASSSSYSSSSSTTQNNNKISIGIVDSHISNKSDTTNISTSTNITTVNHIEKKEELPVFDTAPLSSIENKKATVVLAQFMNKLGSLQIEDGMMGLCQLVDVNHRLNRAIRHDYALVHKTIESEKKREKWNQELIEKRRIKLKLLEERDTSSSSSHMSSSASSSNINLVNMTTTTTNISSASIPTIVTPITTTTTINGVATTTTAMIDSSINTQNGTNNTKESTLSNPTNNSSMMVVEPTTDLIDTTTTTTKTTVVDTDLLNICMNTMTDELKNRTEALESAEQEEEIAKRAYEAAIQKRKKAAVKVDTLESLIVISSQQRSSLYKVNTKRLELENYNITSATGRIHVFHKLNQYLHDIQEKLLEGPIKNELHQLFHHLAQVFQTNMKKYTTTTTATTQSPPSLPITTTMNTGTTDNNGNSGSNGNNIHVVGPYDGMIQAFIAIQVGFETMRLWKQMCPPHAITKELAQMIEEFLQLLQSIQDKIPRPTWNTNGMNTTTTTTTTSPRISKHDNTTVVLYFDHIIHDTPHPHVENQERVRTSIEALRNVIYMTGNMTPTNTTSLINPSQKKAPRRLRTMEMMRCNDIISPPLWILPLVHSPNYLSQLWNLASEAKADDLLVPLEFETEWESDIIRPQESDEDNPTKLNGLRKVITLPNTVTTVLGQEKVDNILATLTPSYGDDIIAKAIATQEKGKRGRWPRKNSLDINYTTTTTTTSGGGDLVSKIRGRPLIRTTDGVVRTLKGTLDRRYKNVNVVFGVGNKVRTPYGKAIITHIDPENPIMKVEFLGHKAIGYINKDNVEHIPRMPLVPELTVTQIQQIVYDERNRSLREDYFHGKLVFKSIITPDGRFKFTHPFYHRLMVAFIKLVEVQRIMADAIQVNCASVSLYVHGRTSYGLSKLIEEAMKKFIDYFDDGEALKFIEDTEKQIEYDGRRKNKKDKNDDDDDVTGGGAGDDIDEDNIIDGSKSMDIKGNMIRKSHSNTSLVSKSEYGKNNMDDDDNGVDGTGNRHHKRHHSHSHRHSHGHGHGKKIDRRRRKYRNRGRPKIDIPSPTVKKSKEGNSSGRSGHTPVYVPTGNELVARTDEDDQIRELIKKMMRLTSFSQAMVAQYFSDNFNIHATQGKLSTWFLYKLREPANTIHRDCGLKWLRYNESYLTANEKETLKYLENWHMQAKTITASPTLGHHRKGRGGFRGRKGKRKHGFMKDLDEEDDNDEDDDEDEEGDIENGDEEDIDMDPEGDDEEDEVNIEEGDDDDEGSQSSSSSGSSNTGSSRSDDDDENSSSSVSDDGEHESARSGESAEGISTKVTTIKKESIKTHPSKDMIVDDIDEVEEEDNEDEVDDNQSKSNSSEGDIMSIDDVELVKVPTAASSSSSSMKSVSEEPSTTNTNHTSYVATSGVTKESTTSVTNTNNNSIPMNNTMQSPPTVSSKITIKTEAEPKSPTRNVTTVTPNTPTIPTTTTASTSAVAIKPTSVMSENKSTSNPVDTKSIVPPPLISSVSTSSVNSIKLESSNTKSDRVIHKIIAFTPTNINMPLIQQLRMELRQEMDRRRMTPILVNNEANLSSWGRGTEAIQAFLASPFMENTTQALQFYNLVLRWLRLSMNKSGTNTPAAQSEKSTISATSSNRNDSLKRPLPSSTPTTPTTHHHNNNKSEESGKAPLSRPADTFQEGYHFNTCEECHEHITAIYQINCALCPAIFHTKCLDKLKINNYQGNNFWCCPRCIETGVHKCVEMTKAEMAETRNWTNKWICAFSMPHRRWRLGLVTSTSSSHNGHVMVKWWRTDNRGGKCSWLNVNGTRILRMLKPPHVSENTRIPPKRGRPFKANDDKSGDEEDDEDPKSARGKKRSRTFVSIPMDNNDGTKPIPKSTHLSVDGIGGRAALYGDEKMNPSSTTNNMKKDKKSTSGQSIVEEGVADTYISGESFQAALCAAGTACRAVDIVLGSQNCNVFACARPPGHHAGRFGCTGGCLSTGFCLLNNAAIALIYARARWGLERIAIVDIDVHFGNGTAEILRNDPKSFFASVHMIYGVDNTGVDDKGTTNTSSSSAATAALCSPDYCKIDHPIKRSSVTGFYPTELGRTEISDNYVSVGILPIQEAKQHKRKKSMKNSNADPVDDPMDDDEEEDGGGGRESEEAGKNTSTKDIIEDKGTSAPSTTTTATNSSHTNTNNKSDERDKLTISHSNSVDTGTNNTTTTPTATPTAAKVLKGVEGFRYALSELIIPRMEKYQPQLLIISAGFDGFHTDPLGGEMGLTLDDYTWCTKQLMASMARISGSEENAKVISLLEGGYDISPDTLGLARCVVTHVKALREGNLPTEEI